MDMLFLLLVLLLVGVGAMFFKQYIEPMIYGLIIAIVCLIALVVVIFWLWGVIHGQANLNLRFH